MELAFVMAGAGVEPINRMFVALRTAELVRLGVQERV
jgi:hypothetical protein